MRVLVATTEWPSLTSPISGIFVQRQCDLLRSRGLDVTVLSFAGRANPVRYLVALRNLMKLLNRQPYDLVHAHFGQAGFLAGLQRQVPVVVTFHGSDLLGFPATTLRERVKSWLLRAVSQRAACWATEVVVVSERLARDIPWRSCYVIPMGIDRSRFWPMPLAAARQSLGWPPEERTVLFVGNPANPVKRFHLARESAALASRHVPDLRLRTCWNEPPERVAVHMNAADVLLVTSSHEGGPLVVREALACRLPVVSVDVGDVRARIEKVHGCFVCEEAQPEAIAHALVSVLSQCRRLEDPVPMEDLDETGLVGRLITVYESASHH